MEGVCEATHAPSLGATAHAAFVRSEAQRLLSESAALETMPARELCKVHFLFYRGDENYGLGNVLYDVTSAAALALALNRTLLYGRNNADRKFGTLLRWPGLLTMQDADKLRRRKGCGTGPLALQRHVMFGPDKCTFHRTWRRERTGHLRCFKRLLGINWLAERGQLLELSKVHAFSGLQTLLKSAHPPLRERVATFVGGCVKSGSRPNVHGVLLGALMRPAPAVAHAVRWAFGQQQLQQRQYAQSHYGWSPKTAGSRHYPWTAPQIGLHVRAMSDFRAKNLTLKEQASQMHNAMVCTRQAAVTAVAQTRSTSTRPPFLSALVVSSSPELRALLVRRIAMRARRRFTGAAQSSTSLVVGAAAGARRGRLLHEGPAAAVGTEPPILPLIFDWRHYLSRAPQDMVSQLSESENAAASFCGTVNASDAHRCNRSAHLRDWGPEPHWVAVVELLLLAAVSDVVVGAGYPYFKVCNTFAQIGAALADASPRWLCSLSASRRRAPGAMRCSEGEPRGMRLLCASKLFSTEWGSSMWRSFNATGRRGADAVVECSRPTCAATPLQPELWEGLQGSACPSGGDTLTLPNFVFGTAIKPIHH